mmetsp:Transcript_71347/g.167036  ORF Transcript_71347/g.167036 Transcript_71347/m.167036 type:complete len:152 (-) Transcript_71347:533-988(-)
MSTNTAIKLFPDGLACMTFAGEPFGDRFAELFGVLFGVAFGESLGESFGETETISFTKLGDVARTAEERAGSPGIWKLGAWAGRRGLLLAPAARMGLLAPPGAPNAMAKFVKEPPRVGERAGEPCAGEIAAGRGLAATWMARPACLGLAQR